jgi:hypothetical protein
MYTYVAIVPPITPKANRSAGRNDTTKNQITIDENNIRMYRDKRALIVPTESANEASSSIPRSTSSFVIVEFTIGYTVADTLSPATLDLV